MNDDVVITPYRDGPLLVRGPFALRDDGTEKVREGITSIAEIQRMTSSLL